MGKTMTSATRTLFNAIASARIAAMIPRIADPSLSPVKGALLGQTLPGVHLLVLVAVLDDALSEYIDLNNIPWPTGTKRDLYNRIEVLSSAGLAIDREEIHRIRHMRNSVAHPDEGADYQPVSWDMLDEAIHGVSQVFVAIGHIDAIPDIVAFYEREPTTYPDELGPNGERVRHNHRVGAKRGDTIVLEYTHDVLYFPPAAH